MHIGSFSIRWWIVIIQKTCFFFFLCNHVTKIWYANCTYKISVWAEDLLSSGWILIFCVDDGS
jgi:hypothetical protein